ncbi:MAG: adenosylmethionine--8-amino-7-oxononanoate transaminase [Planctomycetota bacterium]
MNDLAQRDARVLWHPYTQHHTEVAPLAVARAAGSELFLEDGRVLLDAISSWWTSLHGHGHPRLVRAVAEQAARLDHVLFAGATHAPAVELAERLVAAAPTGLTRVFLSDNGSTAVEVACKIAYHAWVHRGEPERRTFVSLTGSYHGDTFGAMALGDPDPFFEVYAPLLFRVERVPPDAVALTATIERLGSSLAGVVLEPLVQGAGGMRFYAPEVLTAARAATRAAGVPLIADEVMTGFGRTGRLFACEHADVAPDLLCLAKGLSGGIFPLAATLATEELFESFLSEERSRFFPHGHSMTASPLGCAIALESLALVHENDVPRRLAAIGARIHARIAATAAPIENLRHLGGIVAFDLAVGDAGYHATLGPRLRAAALEHGVLLRPLGNVVYAMPPACVDDGQADQIADAMIALARLER